MEQPWVIGGQKRVAWQNIIAAGTTIPLSLALNGLQFSNNSVDFLFFEESALSIATITPDRFDNTGTTIVTVSGTGLAPGQTAMLRFQSDTITATASFNTSSSGTVVSFAPEFCSEWHWSMTYCKVHATGPVTIDVTLDGQVYSSTQLAGSYFELPKPAFLNVYMGPVDGSTLVTIRGEGFVDTGFTQCKFGEDGTPRPMVYLSQSEMVCLTPSQQKPVAKLAMLTFDGQKWIDQLHYQAFQFIASPTLVSVTPASVLKSSAPINVTVSGTSFPGADTYSGFDVQYWCRFGQLQTVGVQIDTHSIRCLTPENVFMEGTVSFSLSFNGQDWHELPSGFSFETPPKCWTCADIVSPSVTSGPLEKFKGTRRRRWTVRENSAVLVHPRSILVVACFMLQAFVHRIH
jgi:hypothetical protein